ncbi:MAG TPA: hypothetical protein VJQ45_07405 [Ktedonobacterales bacterium]|nr:hypothetical protein [Ktedonobacterales bacterium]
MPTSAVQCQQRTVTASGRGAEAGELVTPVTSVMLAEAGGG